MNWLKKYWWLPVSVIGLLVVPYGIMNLCVLQRIYLFLDSISADNITGNRSVFGFNYLPEP